MPGKTPPTHIFYIMNFLGQKEERERKREEAEKKVKGLSFYLPSDLEMLPEEVSIDKFEEYADYRMKCRGMEKEMRL